MKFYILLIVTALCGTLNSQWYPQVSGTNYALKSVFFTNENTGYICGYNTILKTTNSGTNWTSIFLRGNHNSLIFINSLTGFVCADSGKIYKTTNASSSWSLMQSNTVKALTTISFTGPSTGIAAGVMNTLIKTTNGGESWFDISYPSLQIDLLSSTMIDADNYFVTGIESHILRTSNGGVNWIPYTAGEPNPFAAVEFINDNTGFATGCCGMFMSTTNRGVDWTDNGFLSLGFTFHDLEFIDSNTGYSIGDNGMVYRTTNGGAWWDSTITGTDQTLYSISMVNNNTGWVVGNYGTILKTTNGGGSGITIGIQNISSSVPSEILLEQNYPNPFNPETKIVFGIISGSQYDERTTLEIYDINGKHIETLMDEKLSRGIYEVRWNARNYPSGVYFYTLKRGAIQKAKKMLMVK